MDKCGKQPQQRRRHVCVVGQFAHVQALQQLAQRAQQLRRQRLRACQEAPIRKSAKYNRIGLGKDGQQLETCGNRNLGALEEG